MFFFKKKSAVQVSLFNTLTKKLELFTPLSPSVVKLYSCGPTVYDFVHIGNLRSFLLSDLVRRTFEFAGYEVKQVMNVTDFGHLVGDSDEGEDKMTLAVKREGLPLTMDNMLEVATRYVEAFKEDLKLMHVETPWVMPRASEHVPGMVAYIETLLDKGYAYKTSDGVYFDVQKFPNYGAFGGSASVSHSRIGVSEEKRDPRDFALWKLNADAGWQAPWGRGFPGWHIECTAMSTRYLGKSFDIHTGGIDLAPVHHTNEIAQAEAANGKPYARYFMHGEFITIDAQKVAKSLGNTIILAQLIDRGIPALAYRYWLLTGHYRQKMDFTWEAVTAAKTARERALRFFADLPHGGTADAAYVARFATRLYDDLDTPGAVAVMWELIKDDKVDPRAMRATLARFDRVLGIGFGEAPKGQAKVIVTAEAPEEVAGLLALREEARKSGDYARADQLRDDIRNRGYEVEDTAEGPILKRI